MRLIIEPSDEDVADWVAQYVMQRINSFAPTAERPFVLGTRRCRRLLSPAVGIDSTPPTAFCATNSTPGRIHVVP